MKVPMAMSYLQALIASYCIDVDNFEVFIVQDKDMLNITLLRDYSKLDKEPIKDILYPHLHSMLKISSKELMIFINSPSAIILIVFCLNKFDTYFLLLVLYSCIISILFAIFLLAY